MALDKATEICSEFLIEGPARIEDLIEEIDENLLTMKNFDEQKAKEEEKIIAEAKERLAAIRMENEELKTEIISMEEKMQTLDEENNRIHIRKEDEANVALLISHLEKEYTVREDTVEEKMRVLELYKQTLRVKETEDGGCVYTEGKRVKFRYDPDPFEFANMVWDLV